MAVEPARESRGAAAVTMPPVLRPPVLRPPVLKPLSPKPARRAVPKSPKVVPPAAPTAVAPLAAASSLRRPLFASQCSLKPSLPPPRPPRAADCPDR